MATRKTSKRVKTSAKVKKVAKLMKGIDLCMMTTHGSRGSLHARPMSNNGEVSFDGNVWFFSNADTAKVEEIGRDPHVSLGYVGGTKQKPVWITVSGKAAIVRDPKKKKALWLKELERWFEDGPEDPEVVLIHVRGEHASWWSYDEQDEVAL